MGAGVAALWTSLELAGGREGWGVLLGSAARPAHAQQPPPPPMPVAPYIPVEAAFEVEGQQFTVNAFVMVRGREVAVVDTLVPGNAERIGRAIQSAALGWDAVRHVILTHYHFDHAGSAAEVAALAPRATFWAGAADIPELQLPRPVQAANDGDEIFGLQIVATPGHTAGHISVLDAATSSLLTGDAAFNFGGTPVALVPEFTADPTQALASLGKLASLRFDRLLFGHGPAIERDGPAVLARLAAGGSRLTPDQAAPLAAARQVCCLDHAEPLPS